jgi:hypothetical protein
VFEEVLRASLKVNFHCTEHNREASSLIVINNKPQKYPNSSKQCNKTFQSNPNLFKKLIHNALKAHLPPTTSSILLFPTHDVLQKVFPRITSTTLSLHQLFFLTLFHIRHATI